MPTNWIARKCLGLLIQHPYCLEILVPSMGGTKEMMIAILG